MNALAPRRTPIARLLAVVALLVTVCTSLLVVQSGVADAAPARQCFGWSGSTPYRSAGMTLFRGHYDIEWCGVGNRVTEFRVLRCEAGDARPVFVRIPEPRPSSGDCQPRQALNGPSLRIYGDMWAYPTASANIHGVGFNGGRLNVHNEITLYPNGRIVGTTGN